ncbi:phosphoadenylyl-sulfate reductase [Aliivibrio fischeri]|uniref:phosphoadenylyl-sulfate reductase n=1 Tax=Aliivibrio fischeri TaxID=668 RepID=UPI0012D8898E|nr:phosphoadenylyl-sulfate reductase [Aliivibrio fischeri]MUI52494.1 phosphoadenylyl-sulfate reductase [Aliivibrio fischeri]
MQRRLDVKTLLLQDSSYREQILKEANEFLGSLTAEQRVRWALKYLVGNQALTSSFGIQSSVCLHLYNQIQPNIPVIFIDTGYLFPETYQFINKLKIDLCLNVRVFRSEMSPSWQEATYGELWSQGVSGLKKFNRINKVEPMARAINELSLSVWHSGLRKEQSDTRKQLRFLDIQGHQFKFLPILDWSDEDVEIYIKEHDLDYHPLYYKGYVSVGDVHSSEPLKEGMAPEQSRFGGVFRECGLHEEPNLNESNNDLSHYLSEDEK